jgi:hypothetical protein
MQIYIWEVNPESPGVHWCRLVGASVRRAKTEITAASANSAGAPWSISARSSTWTSEGRSPRSVGRIGCHLYT